MIRLLVHSLWALLVFPLFFTGTLLETPWRHEDLKLEVPKQETS
jgi:hypothetical protein